jgi:hypothetical protein
VYGIPKEMRILAMTPGLFHVVNTFHTTASHAERRTALSHFKNLANEQFYKHLQSIFGDYRERVRRFCLDMMVPGANYVEISRDLLEWFMSHPPETEGCYACEKTPHTLLWLPTLWRILPRAKFVHIKRDPRGVLASWEKMSWAPRGGLHSCVKALDGIYGQWAAIQDDAQNDKRYYEVKLEDLCDNPRQELEKMTEFLGLVPCDWPEAMFQWDKVQTRWEKHKERKLIEQLTQPYMELMGYE